MMVKINDFESEIWYRGKVLRGKQAERFLIAYFLFWISTAFTAGLATGYFLH